MKKLRIYISCLLSALLLAGLFPCAASGEELPYVATVFNERSGLPTGEANDVLQTSDGYLWVGSYGGLIRYDGTNFRNYSTEGILPSSSVRMMFEDSSGKLWIGTNDAGVFVYENNEIKRPEGQPDDTFLCVRGFAEDKDGVIYACSNSGAAEIREGVMTVYDAPELSGLTVYSIAADKYGRVWCADSTGGCKTLQNGKVVHSISGEEIFGEGNSVYSITSGIDGEIRLGSSGNRAARIDFLSEGFDDLEIEYVDTGSVSTHNNLRMMKDGTLPISGQHGLGVLYPDGTLKEFSDKDGADSVNSACADYEGNIWIASSSKSIVRFSRGCYTSPNDEMGLENISLNTIAILDGVSYIGSDSGLIICGRDNERIENDLTALYNGERKIRIRHITTDSKGRVWLAAYDVPVTRYDPKTGEIKTFTSEDGLASDRARVLMELSDGRMAVGTQGGLSIISDSGVDKTCTDFAYPSILSLLETKDGKLLAGSDGGGIYEINGDAIINHGFADGLSEGVVLRMLDNDGEGYFISAGSSLYFWDGKTFKKLSNIIKEPGSIFDFYLSDNTLWLLQNNGILAMDKSDLLSDGTGKPITYSFAHGLTGSLNANTWHCLSDGKLYLATRNGISVFSFSSPDNILPKGIINSVNIDGDISEHPKKLEVPKDAQRITIDFSALTFTGTTPVSIAYQLEGFETEETVLADTKSSGISYTNLPGGSYTFRLRIFNDDYPSGNLITLDVSKAKKLSEYKVFWAVLLLAVIAAAVGIVLMIAGIRLRNTRKKQQEYRAILEQSLMTFAGTIDAKDEYTNGHSTRVAMYSRELAKRMGFSEDEQERIYYVALLHDIGKIGIPDNILNKPGKLTDEERLIIQKHPEIGAKILGKFTALDGILEGAKYHHERYDGKGYCEGRKGEDIPLVARIICVADTYDAMSSERCYRKPLSVEKIVSELENGIGTQFDPNVVPHMLDMINEGVVPFALEPRDDYSLTRKTAYPEKNSRSPAKRESGFEIFNYASSSRRAYPSSGKITAYPRLSRRPFPREH